MQNLCIYYPRKFEKFNLCLTKIHVDKTDPTFLFLQSWTQNIAPVSHDLQINFQVSFYDINLKIYFLDLTHFYNIKPHSTNMAHLWIKGIMV